LAVLLMTIFNNPILHLEDAWVYAAYKTKRSTIFFYNIVHCNRNFINRTLFLPNQCLNNRLNYSMVKKKFEHLNVFRYWLHWLHWLKDALMSNDDITGLPN
jgi:hypothetical protein